MFDRGTTTVIAMGQEEVYQNIRDSRYLQECMLILPQDSTILITMCDQAVGFMNFDGKSCYLAVNLICIAHLFPKVVLERSHSRTCPLALGGNQGACLSCATETVLLQVMFPRARARTLGLQEYAQLVSIFSSSTISICFWVSFQCWYNAYILSFLVLFWLWILK